MHKFMLRHKDITVCLSLFAILLCLEVWALSLPYFTKHSSLKQFSITLDLTLLVPLTVFFLARRWRNIARHNLITFMALGLLASGFLISSHSRSTFILLSILEFTFMTFVLTKQILIFRSVKAAKLRGDSFFSTLRRGLEATLKDSLTNPVMRLALTEMQLLYFALFAWLKHKPLTDTTQTFSVKQNSGVTLAFSFMIFFEAVPQHLLISMWSELAAWVLTAINLYALLWLIGDYQAIRLKLIRLTDAELLLQTHQTRYIAFSPVDVEKFLEAFHTTNL